MTKYDLTKYANFAKSAMEHNRNNDEHYTWTLKAINKGSIKFNWSYLGKDEEFVLTVKESDGDPYVTVSMPCGVYNITLLVGEEFYHDVKSVEMGIYKAIIMTADKAKRVF